MIGGGIAGVSAAYELARAGVDFTLYEVSHRLGGIVETVRKDGFVVECGPDSWVTEKPWARELAVELGLEDEILPSNDQQRRTYIVQGKQLVAMPDGLRMMVPTKWEPLLSSPLFSGLLQIITGLIGCQNYPGCLLAAGLFGQILELSGLLAGLGDLIRLFLII